MIHASVKIFRGYPSDIENKINTFFGEIEDEHELIDIKFSYNELDNDCMAMVIYRLITK